MPLGRAVPASPSGQNHTDTESDGAAFLADILETQSDLAAVELDPQIIMRLVAERTRKLIGADGAAVELVEGDWLICHVGSGIMAPHDGRKLSLNSSLAGYAVRSGKYVYCEDIEKDPRADLVMGRSIGVRSLVAVPLFNGATAIGVIVVVSRRPAAFNQRLISGLRLMAGLVVASLSHASEFAIKKKLLAERTEALASLRESQQRFQSAFAHASIGMALVALDGRWLQVNNALCRIVGYTENELLSRDFQSITFLDDLDTDLNYVRLLIAGDIPDYQMVKRYNHRQGHLVWVLLCVSLIRDDNGKPLYFVSQIQDITQRQRTEVALRASEEEYRATFELAGVGKVQMDLATGRFIRVNEKICQITGYSADELRCLTFAQITHPDDLESSKDIAARMLSGKMRDHSTEKRYIRKDGSIIWISLNATVLTDANGRTSRAVATILDITERKHAEWLEQDRRSVLEMVATHMPLPEVLSRLAHAVERQVEGSSAAVMVLHEGSIVLHAPSLPRDFREQLDARGLTLAAKLSEGAWNSIDACGISHLQTDDLWHDLRPAALDAGITTCWTFVIQAVDGTTRGLLIVFCRQPGRPTLFNLQTFSMAGKLATICIEHHHTAGELTHLVRHDRLTGLPNRLMFEDRIQQALAVAGRTGKSVGLLVLDIDKFKSINDTLGHHAGDHLLQQFAHRLRGQLRDADTMARVGGDEFMVILPELEKDEGASVVAQKLLDALTEPFILAGRSIQVTSSIGIALFPLDGNDPVTLQQKADAALYRVKAGGRNGLAL